MNDIIRKLRGLRANIFNEVSNNWDFLGMLRVCSFQNAGKRKHFYRGLSVVGRLPALSIDP